MKKPVFLDIPETFQSEVDLVNIRRYWARIKTSSLHVSVTRRFSKYIFIPDLSCGEEKSSCLSVGDLFQDKCTSSGLRTERWTVRAGWILTRYYILILLTKLPSITKIIIVYSVSFWIVTSRSSSSFPQLAWGAANLNLNLNFPFTKLLQMWKEVWTFLITFISRVLIPYFYPSRLQIGWDCKSCRSQKIHSTQYKTGIA